MKVVKKMPEKIKNMIKEAGELSLQAEFQRMEKADVSRRLYQPLSLPQIQQLAKKIRLLPFEYQSILFFHYCIGYTASEIEKILGMTNIEGKLNYLVKLLSGIMGFGRTWIDMGSMKEACKLALEEAVKEYDSTQISYKPKYSNVTRKKLVGIQIKSSPAQVFLFAAKQVAIFVLILIMAFSSVLAVNVKARTKFLNWVIETFPQFSVFQSKSVTENSALELIDLTIHYMPNGFKLEDTQESNEMLIYHYLNGAGMKITIRFLKSDNNISSYYNTENVDVEEFVLNDTQAYLWQKDNVTSLVWSQDDVECHVAGNVKKDEIIKIAENITK